MNTFWRPPSLVVSLAVLVSVVGAPPAAAMEYELGFTRGQDPAFLGSSTGSVTASKFFCGGPLRPNLSFCSFTLRVVRDGAVVASQGPTQTARVEFVPQQGDVAQLYIRTERGDELVSSVPFDGRPTLDDATCAAVGRTRVSGQLGTGVPSTARIRDGQATQAAVTAAGNRFTAAFGTPTGIGDTLTTTDRHTTTKSGTFLGEDVLANVTALTSAQVCPTIDVNKALAANVVPKGKGARIGALLRRKAFVLKFKTPAAGVARVVWAIPDPDHGSATIASGKRTFGAAGEANVVVKLTARGRKVLKSKRRLKVRGVATLTTAASDSAFANGSFTLRR